MAHPAGRREQRSPMAGTEDVHAFRFHALGSTGRIRLAGIPAARAERFLVDAVGWLRDLESRLTRFSESSLIGRLNHSAGFGSVEVDEECLAVLHAAELAWRLSSGRLDATVLPLYRLWHDPQRSVWPTSDELGPAQALVDWQAVRRNGTSVSLERAGMALDLGGVGKEWAVDRLVAKAAEAGIANCLVELGGDCRARGRQGSPAGWWVSLPGAPMALLLMDEALATSGIGARNRQLEGTMVPHLIDACSGRPATGAIRSATVLADSCLLAGIRASDLCLLERAGHDLIRERSGSSPIWCEAADGRIHADPRLAARAHAITPAAAPA
jgi:thiamine biosynthesis lipoprotein